MRPRAAPARSPARIPGKRHDALRSASNWISRLRDGTKHRWLEMYTAAKPDHFVVMV
jgi:hypothetical protein